MKSAEQNKICSSLLRIFEALIQDYLLQSPLSVVGLDKDLSRLKNQTRIHGAKVFTLWLPALDAVLLDGLERGSYCAEQIPLGKCDGMVKVPRFLRGLYLRVFDNDGLEKADPDISALALLRQLFNLGKKLELEVSSHVVHATVAKYAATDLDLPVESLDWDDPSSWSDDSIARLTGVHQYLEHNGGCVDTKGHDYQALKAFSEAAGWVLSHFPLISWTDLTPKHGPGSVCDIKMRRESKSGFKTWSKALDAAFPSSEFAVCWASWEDIPVLPELTLLPKPSRLTAVPKTMKGPRMIATEPVANQFCQQALKAYMYDVADRSRLRAFIGFNDQSRNQKLCRSASINKGLATIDLSEASDRISRAVVELCFRTHPQLLKLLSCSRNSRIDFTRFGGVGDYPIRKYAGMGNATTFPVETLIFLSCAIGAHILTERQRLRPCSIGRIGRDLAGRLSVYGDDIVIPTEDVHNLQRILEIFKFKVNTHKSFSHGYFRESCGLDCYRGVDITPLKPKHVVWHNEGTNLNPRCTTKEGAASIVSVVALSNNLYKKGYWRAATVVRDRCPYDFPVIGTSEGRLGWFTWTGHRSGGRIRWNECLQRVERKVHYLKVKQVVEQTQDPYAPIIQYSTEKPSLETNWMSGVTVSSDLRIRKSWEMV